MSKKYIILFSVTLVILFGIYFSGNFIKSQVVNVNAIQLSYKSVDNTITCSGKIQAANGTNIFVNSASVVRNINVKVGDTVEAGDILMNVVKSDVQASALPSSMPDLSSLNPKTIETYKQIFNQANNQDFSSSLSKSNNINSNLEVENICAPISGTVTAINVEEGSFAEITKAVATISESNDLEICLPVNESQISEIREGQSATITGMGFKNSQYNGTVNSIAEVAKQSVSTAGQETVVDVLVGIDSTECDDLKTGFTAKCKITTSIDENILIAPYESVSTEADGREYIYKCINDKAVKTYINTGKEFSEGFQILDGAAINDIIILDTNNLNDGDKIVYCLKDTVINNAR